MAEATQAQHFDPSGAAVDTREVAVEAQQAIRLDAITACLELHNGVAVDWKIELSVNPNSYPFHVYSGRITGTICGAPWVVTSGSMGTELILEARREGQGSCANTVDIVGRFQEPSSWAGTYGFNGSRTEFQHTTLFKGWNPCS